ncbi:MAG TPA: hypothetical protein VJB39_01440, partial [Patescibacteria group bacterium]|nr:hypothetical protein [Patescibacteria group bacterium]
MEITIDLSRVLEVINLSPARFIWFVITNGGWLILLIFLLIGLFYLRLYLKRKKYLAGIPQTMLAIDIPKDNEQSLVAMEQIFATLAGIKSTHNLIEKYWQGETQLYFSLEIISFEGYIQFLIRTPSKYRDLTEAAVYAQYPDAEITEVEDYVSLIPADVHKLDSDYDVWATEFTLAKHSTYPVKSYRSFEHSITQLFIDPMASLLEVMSKLGPGEQLGLQLIIVPAGDDWKDKGYEIVKKLIGGSTDPDRHIGDRLVDASGKGLEKFSEAIYKLWGDIDEPKKEKDSLVNRYMNLTTNQKFVVESIENKLSRICFASTFRVYYLAHNDKFQKGRGVNPILGAINQFNSTDLNAFKKHKILTTSRNYLLVKRRIARIQKKLLKYYKRRSRKGSPEFYLSTEELATIYHFPTITVKAPLLKRTESKKAGPPTLLPLEQARSLEYFQPRVKEPAAEPT